MTTIAEVGNAYPVFITNAGDISGGGGSADPATGTNQTAEIAALGNILTAVTTPALATGAATASKQDAQTALLTTINDSFSTLGTATNQNLMIMALDTLVAGQIQQATAAKQDTGNTTLAAIQTAVTGVATAANQVTGNTSLGNILTAVTGVATAANQTTANASLSSIDGKLPASLGSKTKAGSLSVTWASDDALPAGENFVGTVGGRTLFVTVAPTVSTTPAYSAGDNIGGKLTLANALRKSGNTAFIHSIQITDRSNQKPTGSIVIFKTDPTAATLTDNAATVFSTNDFDVIAIIPIVATDYTTINSKAYATLVPAKAVFATTGTTLYAAFVVTSTPTFVATTDLQIVFSFIQD